MHRHETIRGLIKDVIQRVDHLGRHDFSDHNLRINACDNINNDLERAYALILELKREYQEERREDLGLDS